MQPWMYWVVLKGKQKNILMRQLIFILLNTFLATSLGFSQGKVIEKSFDNVNSIKLNTASGSCEVKKAAGKSVKVMVEFTYDQEDFEAKMEMRGTELVMEEKFHARNMRGTSSWTLIVPDNIDLEFNTGSGDLEISDLVIDVDFNSGSGNAEFSNIEGDLICNSGSGDFEMVDVRGELKMNAGSGSHRITKSMASAKLNTGSGEIELENSQGDYHLNSGSGDVSAEMLTQTGSSSFNSGSGDVDIELAASLKNDISVNSGSGDAVLDYNGNPIEGKITMKAKKNGGEIRAPFKFDTEEEIEEGNDIYIQKKVKFGSKDIDVKVGTGTGRAEIKE